MSDVGCGFHVRSRSPSGAIGLAILVVVVGVALIGPFSRPTPSARRSGGPRRDRPGAAPLGTDYLGRDVSSRLLNGGRSVIFIGALGDRARRTWSGSRSASSPATADRCVDPLLMRSVDVLLAFPPLLFCSCSWPALGPSRGVLILGVALVQTPGIARIVERRRSRPRRAASSRPPSRAASDDRRVLCARSCRTSRRSILADFGLRFDVLDHARRRRQLPRPRAAAAGRGLGADDLREPAVRLAERLGGARAGDHDRRLDDRREPRRRRLSRMRPLGRLPDLRRGARSVVAAGARSSAEPPIPSLGSDAADRPTAPRVGSRSGCVERSLTWRSTRPSSPSRPRPPRRDAVGRAGRRGRLARLAPGEALGLVGESGLGQDDDRRWRCWATRSRGADHPRRDHDRRRRAGRPHDGRPPRGLRGPAHLLRAAEPGHAPQSVDARRRRHRATCCAPTAA